MTKAFEMTKTFSRIMLTAAMVPLLVHRMILEADLYMLIAYFMFIRRSEWLKDDRCVPFSSYPLPSPRETRTL